MLSEIPIDVQNGALKLLRQKVESNAVLKDFSNAPGGCINSGGKLTTSAGHFFLKWNDSKRFPNMFQAEANGLKILRSAKAIHVPEVVGASVEGKFQFILLEFIEGRISANYWRHLGTDLAKLHHVTSDMAGLDHSNYIGSLTQINTPQKSWTDFFITNRLEAQLKLLTPIDSALLKNFESLFKKLPGLLVEERHSLLHGDLWSGNLIATSQGEPCLIDPAVYFGNREAEISFTLLFGGFDNEFFEAYHEAFPFKDGFRERVSIYNLYPLLVHANLFGGSYLSQVKSIVKKWS